tara:strand:+ start:504 stop:758 length:255 start_codon:yes stop_codon:yes gene_type:complete
MVTIRDLLKRSKKKIISSSEKIASGSKDTYNKVLDTEVDDIKNVSKKVSRGFVGFLIDFYAVILYFILVGLVIYIGVNVYVFFS